MRHKFRVLTIVAIGTIGTAGGAVVPTMSGTAPTAPNNRTNAQPAALTPTDDTARLAEEKRVDRVPTPKLNWGDCTNTANKNVQCATVRLPLDYDTPEGATTKIALMRVKASDPQERIGSLFINPGGPGLPVAPAAAGAPRVLGKDMLSHFDLVAFDPRGVGDSDKLECFETQQERTQALAGRNVAFPVGEKEETAYIASTKALGKACSTTGKTLAGAMSTAEVARDMDVLRRAVGDTKLSFLGHSYGTLLGQYYANMFPDRVRVMALDGVINPVDWVGTDETADQLSNDRMHTADGTYKALHEMLLRCGKAGPTTCTFATFGDPVANFDILAGELKAKPLDLGSGKITYADLILSVRNHLGSPTGYQAIDADLHDVWQAISPTATPTQAAAAKAALAKRLAQANAGEQPPADNAIDANSAVICTDGRFPNDADSWSELTAAADERAPYFGSAWDWNTVQCAGDSWTVHDENAYTGPFNRRTSAPVLFVGGYYDPATNYDEAVSASKLLPGSRLLSSDSWGHTSYGTSACVKNAVNGYLIQGTLPALGKVCVGDVQPFESPTPHPATSP